MTHVDRLPREFRRTAIGLAKQAHAGQTDKLGKPYIDHVQAVAAGVAHLGLAYEIVGLLHDSLEDCDDSSIVSIDILTDRFGSEISNAVDAITKRDGETYESDYLKRVMANPIAAAVKRADVAHNRSRLHLLSNATRVRLKMKYDRFFELMADCNNAK